MNSTSCRSVIPVHCASELQVSHRHALLITRPDHSLQTPFHIWLCQCLSIVCTCMMHQKTISNIVCVSGYGATLLLHVLVWSKAGDLEFLVCTTGRSTTGRGTSMDCPLPYGCAAAVLHRTWLLTPLPRSSALNQKPAWGLMPYLSAVIA